MRCKGPFNDMVVLKSYWFTEEMLAQ